MVKVQIRLHKCAGLSEPLLSAYAGCHLFAWHSVKKSYDRALQVFGKHLTIMENENSRRDNKMNIYNLLEINDH